MLSAPDADLVRRDRQLPGLASLLDPALFGTAIRELGPNGEVRAARLVWVSYSPGQSCVAGYRVEAGSNVVDVCARAYRLDQRDKLWKDAARPSVPGPLGVGRFVREDHAIVISVFPNDPRLRALPRLVDPVARAQLLRQALPKRQDLWDCEIETLRYKPERRYVAGLLARGGAAPTAKLKIYCGPGYQTAWTGASGLKSRGVLRLARPLGRSDRHRTLALEWLPGRLLSELICAPGFEVRTLALVGAALAELHAQEPDGLEPLAREAEAITLLQVARKVAVVFPRLTRRSHELAVRLASRISSAPRWLKPIHGDFYANQTLVLGDEIGILDLDRAARGDPAIDLGFFIAQLERDVLGGRVARELVDPMRAALLEGYQSACRHALPSGITFYTAVGLLRLAVDPFRNREPDWPERTEAIIARTEALLTEEAGASLRRGTGTDRRAEPSVGVGR